MGFMMDKVALGRDFLGTRQVSVACRLLRTDSKAIKG
jgi:hypothetical protein